MIKHLSLFSAALLLCGSLQAGVIPDVKIAAVSSEYVSGVDHRYATNLVGDVGLYGDVHTTSAQGSMWLASSNTAGSFTNAFVTFDLGSVRKVDRMKIWNYNEPSGGAATNRGVQLMAVSYSADNVNFTTNLASLLLDRAPLAYTNFGQTVELGGIQAQYIRFNILTNYGPGENRVGLSKVQFIDDAVVPTIKLATRNLTGDRVTVQFSEAVQAASANNVTNYTLQSGANIATISSAVLNTYNDTVTLKTSTLNSNLVYTLAVQNVRDLADKVTFDSTPATVENELILWLKPDTGVVADGGGFVSQWTDQSGLGNDAIQSTNGSQPMLVTGAVNGQSAIHFDGTSSLMEVPEGPNIQANRDISVFLVLSSDTLTAVAQSPLSKCPVNVPGTIDVQITKTAGKVSILRGNGSGYTGLAGTAAISANQYYLISYVMRATNASQYLNGNFNGSATVLSGIGDSGTPLRLGIRQDAATRFTGNMAEVMMLRGAVSDSEKASIEKYLGDKYGISVVALEIVENPQNTTVELGKSATLWVSAIAGSPTIYYQWQSNNVNIAGATNAIYKTPALAASGSTYRVLVSTPLGITNISTSATLTVVNDTVAPALSSATKTTTNTNDVVVTFSEAVDPVSATNPANYSFNNGISVVSTSVGAASNQVVLTTSGLVAGTTYLLSVSNVKDMSSNAMSPATAVIFPANLSLWLKADAGVTTDGSGLVSQWADQSPNGNDATQFEGPARRPVYVASSINSKPALTFNGLSNYLSAASSPSLAITGDLTLYVVTRIAPLDVSAYAHLLGKTKANQPASFDYYVQNGANFNPLYRGNGSVNGYVRSTALPSFGEPHVMNVVMKGTSVNHYLDGVGNGSGTISTTLEDGGRPLRIGSRDDLNSFMNGEIAEVLIFNSAVTAAERKMIDSYLGFKYFPFSIAQQPQDASRLEGQTATFSIVASAGSATFDYQWQKNGIDIPGATNASYTTPTLAQADTGSTYRVNIIPLNGAAILSDQATLTVSPDAEPPTVVSTGVQIWNTNKIVVVFSEVVTPDTATNLSNYFLDNGATILSATIGSVSNQVVLTVSSLTPGVAYSLTVQNVKDLFGNTISATTVPNGVYPPSVAVWLKSDAGVSYDGANQVTQWLDQSGNGNNAFPDPGTGPIFIPSTVGGQPGLNFNGTNQYLTVASSPTVAISGDMSIYIVAQIKDFTSTSNEIGLISKSSFPPGGNIAGSYDFYLQKTTGLPRFNRGNGTLYGFLVGSSAPSIGTSHIIAVNMQGTGINAYLDGQLNGSGTSSAPIADVGAPLVIGTRMDFRPWMNGNMQEILVFGAALSDADRASIDAYLGAKYQILLGAVPQIAVNAGEGGTIVLSWPTPSLNFTLETTANLGDAWVAATNTVTSTNGTSSVTVNAVSANQFYRLHQQ